MTLEYVTYPDADDATKKIGVDRRTIGADMVEIQVVALDVAGDGETPSLLAKGQATKADSLPVVTPQGAKTTSVVEPDGTATLLLAANADRLACLLVNAGTVTVYLGKDNTVTTSSGLPLVAGATLSDDISVDAWYGITEGDAGDIRVVEVA